MLDFSGAALGLDFFEGAWNRQSRTVEEFVGLFDFASGRLRNARPSQPHNIDPQDDRRPAARDHKRRHVLVRGRKGAHKGEASDLCELVKPRHPGKKRLVLHLAVAREGGLVHHNDFVSDFTIMRHVAVGHQIIFIADHRGRFGFRPPVDRDVFPDLIVVADPGVAWGVPVGEVLGPVADHGPHMNFIVAADLGSPAEVGSGVDHVVGAHLDPVFDHGMWANLVPDLKLNVFSNDRRRVNLRHRAEL